MHPKETPEYEFPTANIWLRAIAYVMDMALVMLAVWTILKLSYPTGMEQFMEYSREISTAEKGVEDIQSMSKGLLALAEENPEVQKLLFFSQTLTFFGLIFYFTFSELLLGGCTLGKKIFNLRTAYRNSPRNPPIGPMLLRSTVKTFCTLYIGHPILFILTGNFLLAFLTKGRRAGHDLLTHTSVVPGFLPAEENMAKDENY